MANNGDARGVDLHDLEAARLQIQLVHDAVLHLLAGGDRDRVDGALSTAPMAMCSTPFSGPSQCKSWTNMSHAARMSSSRFSTLWPTSTRESESMAATTTSLPRSTVKTKPLPLRPSSASVVMTTYAEDNRSPCSSRPSPTACWTWETQVVGFDSDDGAPCWPLRLNGSRCIVFRSRHTLFLEKTPLILEIFFHLSRNALL